MQKKGPVRGKGGQGPALLPLPLNRFCIPCITCYSTQPGDGDTCSLRAVSIKRRKLIMAKLGAEQETMKQVVCWAGRLR